MRGMIAGLAALVLIAFPASGQVERSWSAKTELGASVFFGNTSQTAVTTSFTGNVEGGNFDLAGRAGFAYGEASSADGATFVNKRVWDVAVNLNYDPGSALNGFVTGKVESILEKKIDLRYNAGAGARYELASEGDIRTETSLAVLAEKTIPREGSGVEEDAVAKWAARFKITKGGDESRVVFETDTTYEPEISDLGTYTLTSRNSIAFRLNHRIAVQLSFVDAYDSDAVSRGARSNNDGQIFFSLVSTF